MTDPIRPTDDGARKQAARLLNVSYKTLLQKIRYCGLEPG